MVSASSCATTFSCLVDRTRVPDPALQRHAVAAFFRRLLTLPALLPVAAHDGISSLLASPHAVVAAHAVASLARLAASRADLLAPDHALPFLLAPLSASPSPRVAFIPCPHMFFRLLTRQENKGIVTAMAKKEKRNTETEVRLWGWGPPMRRHTDSSDCSLDSVAIAWSRPATAPFACTHKGLRACLAASVLLAGLLMVLIFCCWVDDC